MDMFQDEGSDEEFHGFTVVDFSKDSSASQRPDNGANIVKAIKILAQSGKVCEVTEKAVEYAENSEDEPDDSDASSTDQGSDTAIIWTKELDGYISGTKSVSEDESETVAF
ncbi:UNVERIFIED_CONTAM: hypothetical protein FKN15_075310 [Acipenser sinensis]